MNKSNLTINFIATEKFPEINYELKSALRNGILKTLQHENFPYSAEVSLTLCDEQYIHSLNLEYRGVDRPTDVLSFPLEDDLNEFSEGDSCTLGDIVISLERAMEQADEFGHSFKREVAFLCIHSMLHLLGYDHELGEAEDKDMRKRQSDIIKIIGLEIK